MLNKTMGVDSGPERPAETAFMDQLPPGMAEALERQKVELLGTAEELSAFKALEQKEARVEALRRKALRRIQNAGLAAGWSAWHEAWSAKRYALDRLRSVSNKLRMPGLSKAFEFWHGDAAEATRLSSMTAQQRETEAEADLEVLEDTLHRLAFQCLCLTLVIVMWPPCPRRLEEHHDHPPFTS